MCSSDLKAYARNLVSYFENEHRKLAVLSASLSVDAVFVAVVLLLGAELSSLLASALATELFCYVKSDLSPHNTGLLTSALLQIFTFGVRGEKSGRIAEGDEMTTSTLQVGY